MVVKDKYGYNLDSEAIINYLNSLKNSIYKLLPLREEKLEWKKYLESLLELELKGCKEIFYDVDFISLMSKLESLYYVNFYLYRKGIFESLKIVDNIIKNIIGEGANGK